MSNNYKPNDKFVRTSKETSNRCRKEHILRWKWIENDGKGRNYSEINRPNSGYRELMIKSRDRLLDTHNNLKRLAQGGTAVGTGINTHRKFGSMIALEISKYFNRKPIIIKYDENSVTNIGQKLSSIEMTTPYFSQLEIYKAQKTKGFKVSIDGHGADESMGGYVKDIQFFRFICWMYH